MKSSNSRQMAQPWPYTRYKRFEASFCSRRRNNASAPKSIKR